TVEEGAVFLVVVEVAWRQDGRYDGNLQLELDRHETVDHRLGNEFVAVYAAVHHEPAGDDRGVAAAVRQRLGVQGQLERPRHLEQVDARPVHPTRFHLGEKGISPLVDDLSMPAGLDKGEASLARTDRRLCSCNSLIHMILTQTLRLNQGARMRD